MFLLRRLLVTLLALAVAAGCVTPEETREDEPPTAEEAGIQPPAGLNGTNGSEASKGAAAPLDAPGPAPADTTPSQGAT